MYDYKFTESGDYRVSVMGKGDDALALTYTNIAYMKDTEKKSTTSVDDESSDTYYYEDSQIKFGESADDKGVLTGEASEFRLKMAKRNYLCFRTRKRLKMH